jgi:hypothetical protein
LKDGYPITEPHYYANLTIEELKYILRSDEMVEIPLIEERLRVIKETGSVLIEVKTILGLLMREFLLKAGLHARSFKEAF